MREIKYQAKFKKDFKRFKHDEEVIKELENLLKLFSLCGEIPKKYKDHPLIGSYYGYRECHIKPDILLIYKIIDNIIYIDRIGSHSELF